MTIILRGKSALEFWRQVALKEARYLKRKEDLLKEGVFLEEEMPDDAAACILASRKRDALNPSEYNHSAVAISNIALQYGLSLPLHVYSPNRSKTRTDAWVRCHTAAYAPRQLVVAEAGVYVVSPEQCLLDLAADLDELALLLVAYELASIYSEDPDSHELLERASIASVDRLAKTIEETSQVRGLAKARFATKYMRANSRSPRETALVLLLSLPYRLGGANLPLPLLNHPVDLGKKASSMYGRNQCECDLYWPNARLAVFYESDSMHLNRHQLCNDARRDAALSEEGIEVLRVTSEQLGSLSQSSQIFSLVAKRLGRRVRPRCADYYAKREALRRRVL